MAKHTFTDANVVKFLEIALKVFALKQLVLDNQSLYESGHFSNGSSSLLNLAYNEALKQMRP